MLATITAITIKLPAEKSVGQVIKLVGGVTENILPEGRDSCTDPTKKGIVTLQIQGGSSWGFACKMKARYKVAEGGGTEIVWVVRPDEALDDERIKKCAADIRGEQVYNVTFKEREGASRAGDNK